MKTRNLSLAVAGLVIVAAGCAIHNQEVRTQEVRTEYPARYVVSFDNVKVDTTAFEDFINNKHMHIKKWTSNLELVHEDGSTKPLPVDPPPHPPPFDGTSTIDLKRGDQSPGTDSLHVTQKLGLYKLKDLKMVLATVQDQ